MNKEKLQMYTPGESRSQKNITTYQKFAKIKKNKTKSRLVWTEYGYEMEKQWV